MDVVLRKGLRERRRAAWVHGCSNVWGSRTRHRSWSWRFFWGKIPGNGLGMAFFDRVFSFKERFLSEKIDLVNSIRWFTNQYITSNKLVIDWFLPINWLVNWLVNTNVANCCHWMLLPINSKNIGYWLKMGLQPLVSDNWLWYFCLLIFIITPNFTKIGLTNNQSIIYWFAMLPTSLANQQPMLPTYPQATPGSACWASPRPRDRAARGWCSRVTSVLESHGLMLDDHWLLINGFTIGIKWQQYWDSGI